MNGLIEPLQNSTETQLFDEFFNLGFQETTSPFLTPTSRAMGANLTLKAALIASVLLAVAFLLKIFSSSAALSNLLLVFVYFLAGVPALIESIEDLAALEINIDILMTLAAFSSVMIGSPMEGALLLVLFAISGSLEDSVTMQAKQSIQTLQKLSPTKATVISDDGLLLERSVKDIPPGTTILVKAGEIVPLDGTVIAGTSSVNLVHLTGENMPVTKKVGDAVPGGGKNLEGALTLHVDNASQDSTVAKIVRLVTEAQEAKPTLQRWFDRLSQTYATTIILLSIFFTFMLPWIFNIPFLGVNGSLYRSLAFLIAASPCALIIALPIAYLSAISASASRGILLKGGIALDALASCHTIAFDKTGTVTLGELECVEIKPLKANNLTRARQVALALEQNTVHPIASAIIKYCAQWNDPPCPPLEKFTSLPGYGLQSEIAFTEGNAIAYIGNPEYVSGKLPDIDSAAVTDAIASFKNAGEAVAILLIEPIDSTVASEIYIFRFQDTIRPKMKNTIAALKARGLHSLILTGDHSSSARKIAKEIGIDEFMAELKPEDKLHIISELSKKSHLAMVGDGVNDAPALARATIGICMGKVGSTSAIEAADVVLLHDNIEMLDWLFGIAHQTQRIVKQNVFLASLAIIVASTPALIGIVPLWLAVILHEGGTVLVGLNSLRLLKW
jgi:Cd2+/Zn2+-exporting ATPase